MEESQNSGNSGMKIVGWIVIVALVIWGVYAFSKKSPTETGPIKIGVIAPLTGDAASYGEPAANIYKLAVKEINDAGGVNGRMLELILEDGKCNGTSAASAAQKLVSVDKVQIIMGGFCSGESLAALPVAEGAKVAMFSPGSSSPDLTGKSPFFVRNYPSDSFQGKVLADIAYNKVNAKSAYILVEQTEYAHGIAKVFDAQFTAFGGTVTMESFPSNSSDMRDIVTKAKSANTSVLMIVTQTPATAQKILKSVKDLKWKPKIFINDVPAGDPATLTTYKDILEGAYTAEVGMDANNPIFKHAIEAYKTAYGLDMPFQSYAQTEWDALFIIRDGLKAVGNDGTKLANWFHTSVKDWQGATGSVTIGVDGDPLIGHRAEVIKNGKTEVLQ